MNVLVVEDEVRLADAIGELLKKEKYLVDVVNDGQEGYEFARMQCFQYSTVLKC